jgi:hypothetical protein
MFLEELFHRFVEIEFVFFVPKAITFVFLDKNVQTRFPGLEKRNRLAIGRKIIAAADVIAEKIAHWNLRRDFRDGRRCRSLGEQESREEDSQSFRVTSRDPDALA